MQHISTYLKPYMDTTRNLRRQMQTSEQFEESDKTRLQLEVALRKTRQEQGGLSMLEIAEIIQFTLEPEEVLMLKNNL